MKDFYDIANEIDEAIVDSCSIQEIKEMIKQVAKSTLSQADLWLFNKVTKPVIEKETQLLETQIASKRKVIEFTRSQLYHLEKQLEAVQGKDTEEFDI